jgi:uncharacterized protein YndB with AHSA1/START domain
VAERNESSTADREISTTRLFNAPRDLVYRAWTEPEHMAKWWGPRGFTNTIHEMDVRPGGVCRLTMHGPDGTNYPNKLVFVEVVKPARLVYKHSGGDQEAQGTHFDVTVTFTERGGQTEVMLKGVFATAAERDRVAREYGAVEGQTQMLERLEEYLKTM